MRYILFKKKTTGEIYSLPMIRDFEGAPTDGLIAWYKLNGNGNDETGNYDGTPNSDATFEISEIESQCLSAGKIDIPFEILGSVGSYITNPYTFSAWIYYRDSDNREPIIQFGGYYNGIGIGIYNGHPRIATVAYGYNRSFAEAYQFTLKQNQWYHITAVYGSQYLKVYVNGVLVALRPKVNARLGSNEACIGGIYNGQTTFAYLYTNTPLESKLDDVRIYNRELTDDEIKQLVEIRPDTSADWLLVANDESELTETTFLNYGIPIPTYIPKEKIQELGIDISILQYPSTETELQLRAIPKKRLLIRNTPIDLTDYSAISLSWPTRGFNTNFIGEVEIRFLFSRDKINWYRYNFDTRQWELVYQGELNALNEEHINIVATEGMLLADVTAIADELWDEFYGGNLDQLYYAMSFYEPDPASTFAYQYFRFRFLKPAPYYMQSIYPRLDNDTAIVPISTAGKYKIFYLT